MGDDLRARTIANDPALVHQEHAVAELRDRLYLMRDEDNRSAGRVDVLHPPEAAGLKLSVADAQHLVHQHDLRLEVRRDGEREADVHPARIALHRSVEELLDAGELGDLGHLGLDLAALHAEDRPVQEHVLSSRQLGVEACSHFEKAADATPDLGAALRRRRNPREDLEERRLPRPVAADEPESLAFLELERDVA